LNLKRDRHLGGAGREESGKDIFVLGKGRDTHAWRLT